MSTPQPPLDPSNAPYVAGTVPLGWDRPIEAAEADAGNLLYPVPPYGATYNPPGDPNPPPATNAEFVKIDQIVPGLSTMGRVSKPELMRDNLIFTLWPIAGVLGIVDDVGNRPVRVLSVADDTIEFNFDSTGLDTTGLVLLGVVYTGP